MNRDNLPQPVCEATIRTSRLFDSFSASDIDAILSRSTSEERLSRCWIFRQGDVARHLYLLESGLIRLTQTSAEGDEVLVRLVKPGEVFGEFSLTSMGPNTVACQTIQPSRLITWDRGVAMQLLASHPRLAINLLNLASYDITNSFERMRRLLTEPASERVAWAVSQLVHAAGVPSSAGVVISGGVGQSDIAAIAGTTIFTVSRELSLLQRRGLLQKQRHRIVVLLPEKS